MQLYFCRNRTKNQKKLVVKNDQINNFLVKSSEDLS